MGGVVRDYWKSSKFPFSHKLPTFETFFFCMTGDKSPNLDCTGVGKCIIKKKRTEMQVDGHCDCGNHPNERYVLFVARRKKEKASPYNQGLKILFRPTISVFYTLYADMIFWRNKENLLFFLNIFKQRVLFYLSHK